MICSLTLLQSDNPLYNPDDTAITFSPWGGGTETNEPGYARVGCPPGHKGYAHLKPTPERCRSEYQKLLKPSEGKLSNRTQVGEMYVVLCTSVHECTYTLISKHDFFYTLDFPDK